MSFKTRDVEDLLTLYGITDEQERASLVSLAKEANVAGWWHSYSDVLPSWFPTYVGLEGAASLLRAYEVQFVHGLLQTEEYARAVVRRGMKSASDADVERRVALRLERQKYLVAENAPEFHVVLDEAALRRPYGDRAVMRGQLQHLIEVSERPNVRLQVVPFSMGGHPGSPAPSPSSAFPSPTSRTWCTWSSSPARSIWTSPRTWPSTRRRSRSSSTTARAPPRAATCSADSSSCPEDAPGCLGRPLQLPFITRTMT